MEPVSTDDFDGLIELVVDNQWIEVVILPNIVDDDPDLIDHWNKFKVNLLTIKQSTGSLTC